MKTPVLAATMIVKDESHNLRRCLDSVAGVVEKIIIVDTGSTDDSVEIARSYGAYVYPGIFNWRKAPIFNFSLHRNSAFQYAEELGCDWHIIIDADESLEIKKKDVPILKERLARITPLISGLAATVHEVEDGEIKLSWYGHRLFRAGRNTYYEGRIHNEVKLDRGWMAGSDIVIYHYGYKEGPTMEAKRARTMASLDSRIRENPDDYNAWFYKCVSLCGQEKYEEAIEAGHKCLEIISTYDNIMADPAGKLNFYGNLYFTLGFAWMRLKDGPKAYAAYRKGYDIWPDDLDLNFGLAELGYFAKEDDILRFHAEKYLKALEKYRKELRNDHLESFVNKVEFKNLALSNRHIHNGTKRAEDAVHKWLEILDKKAA